MKSVAGSEAVSKGLIARSLLGGSLMGLANLVPGISGGTMLLAAGVYPDFIAGIAEVTRLQFRLRTVAVLGCVVAAAMTGILLFAGPVKDLVVNHRWVMYSLFIGLTLGGVPIVRQLAGDKVGRSFWVFASLGFLGMGLLALAQQGGWGQGATAQGGLLLMFLAGVAGASAMILPGVSGGYLLLVLGAYIPILSGIDGFKEGLKQADLEILMSPAVEVVLPVGLGVVVGVAAVSNVLKVALEKFEQQTLGTLLGLLVGAVVGLWPFQRSMEPVVGMIVKGRALTNDTLGDVDLEDLPTEFFSPELLQVAGAVAMIAVGLAITYGVSWLGSSSDTESGQGEGDV